MSPAAAANVAALVPESGSLSVTAASVLGRQSVPPESKPRKTNRPPRSRPAESTRPQVRAIPLSANMAATSVPLYAAPTSPGVGKPVTVTVGASSSTSETRLLAPT